MSGSQPRLVLVDGSAYIFRAFHALPPMSRRDGTPVNAVFGFTGMIMKLMEDEAPDYAIVVLDKGRRTFRNDIYPDYKANRSEPDEDLIPQFPLVREATRALGLPLAEMQNFEADDLIATYAALAKASGMQVTIISSDKDLMQLVGGSVAMYDPMKSRHIGADEVMERFGVAPDKVIDVQALAGDSTDNVPGVPGIGVKTAAELINTYGSLDELLERAGEIKQPKRRENLIEHAEMARVSRQLVTLRDDAPLPLEIKDCAHRPPDTDTLRAFLAEQEFASLLRRLDGGASAAASAKPSANPAARPQTKSADDGTAAGTAEYELITDTATLEAWVAAARKAGVVAVDCETTSLTASIALVVGISLALAPGRACYIPLRHGLGGGGLDLGDAASPPPEQMDFDKAVAILRPLFADPAILKIGHNIKYDSHVLAREENGGFAIAPVDDTMCLSFVLDAGRQTSHGLDELAEIHCGHGMIKYEDVCGKGAKKIGFDALTPMAARDYAAEDADYTLRLWHILKPRLAAERRARVYERLERPLIAVLAAMEAAGIKVDSKALQAMSRDFAARLAVLEEEIHALAGEAFNVASPKQLGEILFDKMGLEGGKKSAKTGAWSTDAGVLDDLVAGGVPIAEKVLAWRQLAKLKSTYADALAGAINPATGRVHTSFSMVGAATGRLSSSDPNLQNIPIRTAEGRAIRRAFVAEQGAVLISADYSQIELRLVAHIAGETRMIEAFHGDADIHAETASEVFGIPVEGMPQEMRRRAKAINFGIIYGISGFGLGRQLGIPRDEARDYIKAYFTRFPGIRDYMEAMKEKAREDGFVETLYGRRLYITGITAKNPAHRGFAERQAINAPIQGTAADIIKQAMTRMPAALIEAKSPARMLLQVHDELVFECPAAEAGAAAEIIRGVMENAATPALALSVPLVVEAKTGTSWDEAH